MKGGCRNCKRENIEIGIRVYKEGQRCVDLCTLCAKEMCENAMVGGWLKQTMPSVYHGTLGELLEE